MELGQQLYQLREEGSCVDVIFSVLPTQRSDGLRNGGHTSGGEGDERIKIPAHRVILTAASDYFRSLESKNWKNDEGDGLRITEITIPQRVTIKAVDIFIKYMYIKELPTEEDLKDLKLLLDIFFLADYFLVHSLRERMDSILTNILSIDNCLELFLSCQMYDGLQSKTRAFMTFMSNIELTMADHVVVGWDAETWGMVLNLQYFKGATETLLFRKLLSWKNADVYGRGDQFQELVRLVRFHLMGIKDFSEIVVPSGALNKEDVIEIFVSFGSKCETKYSAKPRNVILAKDAMELHSYLSLVTQGDIIQLENNTYRGNFTLNQNCITIRGKQSVIVSERTPFTINSSQCKLTDISFVSTNLNIPNKADNICSLKVKGHQNSFINISVTGGTLAGILIQGDGNIIESLAITGPTTSIRIFGNYNTISQAVLVLKKTKHSDLMSDDQFEPLYSSSNPPELISSPFIYGVVMDGSRNVLCNLSYTKLADDVGASSSNCPDTFENKPKHCCAICVAQGEHNRVEDVHFVGMNNVGTEGQVGHDWGIRLLCMSQSSVVKECGSSPVFVEGLNQILNRVNGGNLIEVAGSKTKHVFEDCISTNFIESRSLHEIDKT